MQRKKCGGWWVPAGVVVTSMLLLLAGYAGAYYATVHSVHRGSVIAADRGNAHGASRISFDHVSAEYDQIFGIQPDWLFSPMNAIDRKLRPKLWTADPPASFAPFPSHVPPPIP